MMKALLIVDVQRDFCPGGALPAPRGNEIVTVINNMLQKFSLIIASRDEHPEESKHFEKWPKHCIRGTKGATFHPDLEISRIEHKLIKGTEGDDDGYSAFEATNGNLDNMLSSKGVTDVYVAGLTTEYCVKNTVIDSLQNGYTTYVVKDGIASVEPGSENEAQALNAMKEKGAQLIDAAQIK